MRQVGNVAHDKPADVLVAEDRLKQDDHGLLIGIPTFTQHFMQETVADGEELGTGPLRDLADLAGFVTARPRLSWSA